jgi:pimeloyl-ACP methyl ester carboxylesterase
MAVSLGAMVALDWCNRFPSDFERLVVINTSARNLGTRDERFSPRFIAPLAGLLLGSQIRHQEDLILKMTSNLEGAQRDAALERNIQIATAQPIPRRVAVHQLLAAARFKAPARLPIPTLVIRSLGDRLVNPECSARLARRLGAPMIEHPDAGHDLALDDPDWLAKVVAHWVGN